MIKIMTKDNRTVYINPTYVISVSKMNHTDHKTIIEMDYVSGTETFYILDDADELIQHILKRETQS